MIGNSRTNLLENCKLYLICLASVDLKLYLATSNNGRYNLYQFTKY